MPNQDQTSLDIYKTKLDTYMVKKYNDINKIDYIADSMKNNNTRNNSDYESFDQEKNHNFKKTDYRGKNSEQDFSDSDVTDLHNSNDIKNREQCKRQTINGFEEVLVKTRAFFILKPLDISKMVDSRRIDIYSNIKSVDDVYKLLRIDILKYSYDYSCPDLLIKEAFENGVKTSDSMVKSHFKRNEDNKKIINNNSVIIEIENIEHKRKLKNPDIDLNKMSNNHTVNDEINIKNKKIQYPRYKKENLKNKNRIQSEALKGFNEQPLPNKKIDELITHKDYLSELYRSYSKIFYGENKVLKDEGLKIQTLILKTFLDPSILLLFSSGVCTTLIGLYKYYSENDTLSWIEGACILCAVFIILVINVYTEAYLQNLFKKLSDCDNIKNPKNKKMSKISIKEKNNNHIKNYKKQDSYEKIENHMNEDNEFYPLNQNSVKNVNKYCLKENRNPVIKEFTKNKIKSCTNFEKNPNNRTKENFETKHKNVKTKNEIENEKIQNKKYGNIKFNKNDDKKLDYNSKSYSTFEINTSDKNSCEDEEICVDENSYLIFNRYGVGMIVFHDISVGDIIYLQTGDKIPADCLLLLDNCYSTCGEVEHNNKFLGKEKKKTKNTAFELEKKEHPNSKETEFFGIENKNAINGTNTRDVYNNVITSKENQHICDKKLSNNKINEENKVNSLNTKREKYSGPNQDVYNAQTNNKVFDLPNVLLERKKAPHSNKKFCVHNEIYTDESMVLGGSTNTLKNIKDLFLYEGTYIIEGEAKALVIAVGKNTYKNRTIENVNTFTKNRSLTKKCSLELKVEKLTKNLAKSTFYIAFILIIAQGLKYSYPLYKFISDTYFKRNINPKDIITIKKLVNYVPSVHLFFMILIDIISIIVMAVPEGIPMALSLNLGIAAKKLLKEGILIKNVSACGLMKDSDILVTDKTGTLTHNEMCARYVYTGNYAKNILPKKQNMMRIKLFRNRIQKYKNVLKERKPKNEEIIHKEYNLKNLNGAQKFNDSKRFSYPNKKIFRKPGNRTCGVIRKVKFSNIPEKNNLFSLMGNIATLNCLINSSGYEIQGKFIGSMNEGIFLRIAKAQNIPYDEIRSSNNVIGRCAFSSKRGYMSTILKINDKYIIFIKGCAEKIGRFCKQQLCTLDMKETTINNIFVNFYNKRNFTSEFFNDLLSCFFNQNKGRKIVSDIHSQENYQSDTEESEYSKKIAEMVKEPFDKESLMNFIEKCDQKCYRTLSFAYTVVSDINDKSLSLGTHNLVFLCAIGIEDPIRENFYQNMISCNDLGLKIMLMTGDRESMAEHISKKMGICRNEPIKHVNHGDSKKIIPNIYHKFQSGEKKLKENFVLRKERGIFELLDCQKSEDYKQNIPETDEISMKNPYEPENYHNIESHGFKNPIMNIKKETKTIDNYKEEKVDKSRFHWSEFRNFHISGYDLRKMSHKNLLKIIKNIAVVSRADPKDKVRIIDALHQIGTTVAVSGDGSNDRMALKKADIGISLKSGTDIAKEAASIILLNDDFKGIVRCIEYGGFIEMNVRKYVQLQLVSTISTIIIAGSMSIFLKRGQSIFTPIKLLWINLIIDMFFVISLIAGLKPVIQTKREEYSTAKNNLYDSSSLYNEITPVINSNEKLESVLEDDNNVKTEAETSYLSYNKNISEKSNVHQNLGFPDNAYCEMKENIYKKNIGSWDLITSEMKVFIIFSISYQIALLFIFWYKSYNATFLYNMFVYLQLFTQINSRTCENSRNPFRNIFKSNMFWGINIFIIIVQYIITNRLCSIFQTKSLNLKNFLVSILIASTIVPFIFIVRSYYIQLKRSDMEKKKRNTIDNYI